ncbi:MAG: phage major capsid protein [Myxococcaceae bacterium]|nr:MAG: phage major capsid protein [Myxococcaceae bacterium]
MPSYIGRGEAVPFIVEQRSPEILQQAAQTSVAMNTFNKRPVASSQAKLSMLDTFPSAKWLTATPPADVDIAVKPTTEMAWKTVDMYIEEAATIVLIPENVLDDSEVNLWAEVKNRCAEAIARLIDQTTFFGSSPDGSAVPTTFPAGGIVGQAKTANHAYKWGTNSGTEDLAEAWNQTMSLVEADGYDVSASYADRGIRPYFRGMRDGNGSLLYASTMVGAVPVDSVYGVGVNYVTSGVWDKSKAVAVMGDPQWAVLGIRQQLTSKNLDQATIDGVNLAEQDMLGLRLKIRLGFIVLAPKGQGQTATPYPFAVLEPKAPRSTGATQGAPGTWAPSGSLPPHDLANLRGTPTITATPQTKWTTGNYVVLGDNSHAHWDADSWEAGDSPVLATGRGNR